MGKSWGGWDLGTNRGGPRIPKKAPYKRKGHTRTYEMISEENDDGTDIEGVPEPTSNDVEAAPSSR